MDSKKTIWILNHHATGMAFQHGGRHYYFAKYLIKKGYEVRIFCASSFHGNEKQAIDLEGKISRERVVDGIPFVFVKSRDYKGNGASRVLNMIDYYLNVKKASKFYPKPDVIIGSSVHPLACVATINLSRRYKCKNIVEIRDLWPESIVEFAHVSKNSPTIWLLYRLEHWLYKKADCLIFTIEGGYDYIKDKKWDNEIPSSKVFHINNGVDLNSYAKNTELSEKSVHKNLNLSKFNIVYVGSIRKANSVGLLLKAAKILKNEYPNIQFSIFGDGEERAELENYKELNKLSNVRFLGVIPKDQVPPILAKSNCNVLNYQESKTWKYGGSQNKLFEYLASGKPIVSNIKIGYSLLDKYNCGIHAKENTPEAYAEAILRIYNLGTDEYNEMCENALKVAQLYDFPVLTEKLIQAIES